MASPAASGGKSEEKGVEDVDKVVAAKAVEVGTEDYHLGRAEIGLMQTLNRGHGS